MRKPNMLEITAENVLGVADHYEYSMAYANFENNTAKKKSIFDVVVRNMPTNKVVGEFEHEGVTYPKLAKRSYLINAGLEQAVAYMLEGEASEELVEHMEQKQQLKNKSFLNWLGGFKFDGDVYAMPEGTPFFAHESQMRIESAFEDAQLFESLYLNTINPQTNVASNARDLAEVTDSLLMEGGSRRGGSPQSALFNARAAIIGGFHVTSLVQLGIAYDIKVGGTHGHSYVMLHPEEYEAFEAQANIFENDVCFLLDTYNVHNAFEKALEIKQEKNLEHIAFRIDSGNLLEQAVWIHEELNKRRFAREEYTLVASDDLNPAKIRKLEEGGANIDKYLVGTYVVNPPKPLGGVFKLAAYYDEEGIMVQRGKLAEDSRKSTLPGRKQVYRIEGEDGMYKCDVIAFEGEDISKYVRTEDTVHPLLIPVIKNGAQVYDFPLPMEIHHYAKQELAKFADIDTYEVIVSEGVESTMNKIREQYGMETKKAA